MVEKKKKKAAIKKKTEKKASSQALYPYISITQINTYLSCPMKWKYRYIDGIVGTYGGIVAFGIATHHALQHNYTQKIYSREDRPVREVVDVFADELEKQDRTNKYDFSSLTVSENLDIGQQVLGAYMEDKAKHVFPIKSEHSFSVELPGISRQFRGIIDLIDNDMTLIEFKTKKRAPSANEASRHFLQLSGYAYGMLALCKSTDDFTEEQKKKVTKNKLINSRIDYFIRTKKGSKAKSMDRLRASNGISTSEDMKVFLSMVKHVDAAIDKGVFVPNIGGMLCSPKYCSYWDLCRKDLGR